MNTENQIVKQSSETPIEEVSESRAENSLSKELLPHPNESANNYLIRMDAAVTQKIWDRLGKYAGDVYRMKEADLSEEERKMIADILVEASRTAEKTQADPEQNNKALSEISEHVGFHDKIADSSEKYDETARNREFFEPKGAKGAAKRESYWKTLFFTYNTKETRAYAGEILNGKSVILLGGGRSALKQEFNANNIHPESIINIDPFVDNPSQEQDPVIPLSATDEKLTEKLLSQNIGQADEIWAEFSVPAYLRDPQEIRQLIKNIDSLLKVHGKARIWPLLVGNGGTEDDESARKSALTEALRELSAGENYEIIMYKASGNHGVILHKVKLSQNEVLTKQNKRETEKQTQIDSIRKELGL